jgi:capsule biosynthesis phosphatase
MKICIDVDGVLCEIRQSKQNYADVSPLPGAVEKMRALKAAGHYLIIHTARHMKTCQGNVGMIVAKQGKVLLDWLELHCIPYDEIYFGKPRADVYVDDNAYRFVSWDEIDSKGDNLPLSNEKRIVLHEKK